MSAEVLTQVDSRISFSQAIRVPACKSFIQALLAGVKKRPEVQYWSATPKNMLGEKINSILDQITKEAGNLVASFIDKSNLTGKVDFASIYAHNAEEFTQFTKELQNNGSIADIQPTGNYYWLNKPLKTAIGTIRRCRIRIFDPNYHQRGYTDFEVVNYTVFKDKYLKKPQFTLVNKSKVQMIELRAPEYNVRAYFPNIQF